LTYIEQFPANYVKKLGDPVANVNKWREVTRAGVPDKQKRKFILAYFQIDPVTAHNQYELVKSIAGEEFISLT